MSSYSAGSTGSSDAGDTQGKTDVSDGGAPARAGPRWDTEIDRRSALRALGASGSLALLPVGSARAASRDAPPTVTWSQLFDGDGGDDEFAALAPTADCGFVLVGSTDPVGAARADGWMVKTRADGTEAWRQTVSGVHQRMRLTDVVAVPGVGYGAVGDSVEFEPPGIPEEGEANPSLGRFFGTDFDGTVGVRESYYAPTDTAAEMALESLVRPSDGGFTMAGQVNDFLGPEPSYGWLQRTTADGTKRWGNQYDPSSSRWLNTFTSHVQSPDCGFLLAGDIGKERGWVVKTSPDGAVAWERTYGTENDTTYSFVDVVRAHDDGYVLAGTQKPYYGFSYGWLVKVDDDGTMQWERTFSTNKGSFAALARTHDSGYVVVGVADDEFSDGWIVKTTADGHLDWDRRLGAEYEFARLHDVVQVGVEEYVAAGARRVCPDSWDGWLVKLA